MWYQLYSSCMHACICISQTCARQSATRALLAVTNNERWCKHKTLFFKGIEFVADATAVTQSTGHTKQDCHSGTHALMYGRCLIVQVSMTPTQFSFPVPRSASRRACICQCCCDCRHCCRCCCCHCWFHLSKQAIGPNNVSRLTVAWSLNTSSDVSTTISVMNGTAFIVDWGGSMHAVNASTGATKWKIRVVDLLPQGAAAGVPSNNTIISRTTPALYATENGTIAVIGTQGASVASNVSYVVGVNASTGAALWAVSMCHSSSSHTSTDCSLARTSGYMGLGDKGAHTMCSCSVALVTP